MLGSPKNTHYFFKKQKQGGKTMCNLPTQIHDETETRNATKKAETAKQDDLKISVSHLVTIYPNAS
jgi:hypothetical protein